MTRRCKSCDAEFEPAAHFHRLCWPCWRAERDQATRDDAYHQGYQDGLKDAMRSTLHHGAPGHPTPDLLRDAIALCHPDRHPPERAEVANRVTAGLLDLRQRMAPAA